MTVIELSTIFLDANWCREQPRKLNSKSAGVRLAKHYESVTSQVFFFWSNLVYRAGSVFSFALSGYLCRLSTCLPICLCPSALSLLPICMFLTLCLDYVSVSVILSIIFIHPFSPRPVPCIALCSLISCRCCFIE